MSYFDVEGDSGIVARAYGTACRILKVQHSLPSLDTRLSPIETERNIKAFSFIIKLYNYFLLLY